MQSFQKLVPLIALLLFASQEAVALPQPQLPKNAASNAIGSVGNQIGVASGNISPSSVNGGNRPFPGFPNFPGYPFPGLPGFPGFPGVPRIPSGNTAASTIGTAGNQIGVASGNINPNSFNARDELDVEARQFYPGYYFPNYYPGANSASSSIGSAGNQIGVASGNINPTSTNYPRED